MICPKCGHQTTGNFCSNCGALLKQNYSPADRNPTYRQNQDGRGVRAWAPEHEEPAEKDTVRDDIGRTDADGLEPFIRGESYIETGQEARAERRTPVGTAYAREPEKKISPKKLPRRIRVKKRLQKLPQGADRTKKKSVLSRKRRNFATAGCGISRVKWSV